MKLSFYKWFLHNRKKKTYQAFFGEKDINFLMIFWNLAHRAIFSWLALDHKFGSESLSINSKLRRSGNPIIRLSWIFFIVNFVFEIGLCDLKSNMCVGCADKKEKIPEKTKFNAVQFLSKE